MEFIIFWIIFKLLGIFNIGFFYSFFLYEHIKYPVFHYIFNMSIFTAFFVVLPEIIGTIMGTLIGKNPELAIKLAKAIDNYIKNTQSEPFTALLKYIYAHKEEIIESLMKFWM